MAVENRLVLPLAQNLRQRYLVPSETTASTGDKGRTPSERMDNALRAVLKVPKEVVLREEAKQQRKRERKREKKRG